MTVQSGTRFGSYEIAEPIGAGGMGEVWLARDRALKRDVAVKVLPDALIEDADRLARFQREAEILASLNHANIAQVYGLEQAEGRTAIVMELIEGPTLADRIAEGAIPPDDAMDIALQILSAIEAAHDKGIVHRDLKPANVKLRGDGTVKVLDFGISKPIDASAISGGSPVATTPAVTETGVILGTAAYMSPEQAKGQFVDERTDIWAFGCLLFEMLTGQPAFAGEDVMAILARVLERDTDLRSIPGAITPAVRHTIGMCLEKDPRKRIADIRDVRLALEGRFDAGPFDGSADGNDAPSLLRRALSISGAAAVGALFAGSAVWTTRRPGVAMPSPMRFRIEPQAAAPLANSRVDISPDGLRLVYVAENPQTNNRALYLRGLDTLDARPIPGTEGLQPSSPFFSANGQSVGFASTSNETIMRVSLDGGAATRIANYPSGGGFGSGFTGASWTADGTVFFSGRSLYRVADGGGGITRTIAPFSTGRSLSRPEPLPGQRAVLFQQIQGPESSIRLLDLETEVQKELMPNGTHPTYVSTGHIVFMRDGSLMAVPFDPDRLETTGESVVLEQGIRGDYAISDTGTLAYVTGAEQADAASTLVLVDRLGAVVRQAVSEPIDGAQHFRLSPDGQRVAVTTGPRNDNDLWIYDLGGRAAFPVATENDEQFAAWHPDGTRIAYLSIRDGNRRLMATSPGNLLDSVPLRTDGLNAVPQAWTNSGEMILDLGGEGIAAVSEDGAGDVRVIVGPESDVSEAALSRNGRWLAFTSDRTGMRDVWVQEYPDGTPFPISTGGGYDPVWAPDGQELFYLRGDTMMSVAFDTEGDSSFEPAPATELFTSPDFVSVITSDRAYDVTPDGLFLMVRSASAEPGQIIVVVNWFEELRRRVPTG